MTEIVHHRGRKSSTSSFKRSGFTLVELLIALAIFMVVSFVLVSITVSLSNVWQQGIAHRDRRAAALAVFERMADDFRNAAQPLDRGYPKLQMVIDSSGGSLSISKDFEQPQVVFWQSPAASSCTNGNLAEVGYFIQWVTNNSNVGEPMLCRLYVDPSSPSYSVYSSGTSSWSSTITDALLTGTSGAPATRASGYQGQLAKNVLGLWVQALDQRLQPITNDASGVAFGKGQFDSSRGYASTMTYASGTRSSSMTMQYPGVITQAATSAISLAGGNGSLPAAVEVAIVTVDGRTALRLSGTEKPSAPTGNLWADVNTFYNSLPPKIKNGAEIHSTVINLDNAPR